MTDFVKLYPQDFAWTVRVLLDLAVHQDDVATDTDNGFGLRIPTYLHERWLAYQGLDDQPVAPDQSTPDAGNVDVVPKKRGRPRKPRPDEEG